MTLVKRLTLLSVLMAAVLALGCGKDQSTTKPASFAPPPNPKDPNMKGDTAPGPP